MESQRLRRRDNAQAAISSAESAANSLIGATGDSPEVTQALQVANARIQKEVKDRRIKAAREAGMDIPDRQNNREQADMTRKATDARVRAQMRMSKIA